VSVAQVATRSGDAPSRSPLVERVTSTIVAHPRSVMAIYLGAVAVSIVVLGFPTRRDGVFAIVGVGLLLASVGQHRAWKRVVLDWLPLFAILTLYDTLRAHADSWGTPHVLPQIRADEWLFGGTVPTVWLQRTLFTPGTAHWWDYGVFLVYVSHFVVPIAAAAVLWKVSSARFRRYALLFVTLTFAAFATYALYPAVPPWLASRNGALAPTTKMINEMWAHVGLAGGADVLSSTSKLANPVAAIPSLHAAYPFLLMLFFWGMTRRYEYRLLLALYPLAMGFALVYSAEHYVIDILLGWAYALVVFVVGSAALDHWATRRARLRETIPSSDSAPACRARQRGCPGTTPAPR
jgi:PAP2 superfamily